MNVLFLSKYLIELCVQCGYARQRDGPWAGQDGADSMSVHPTARNGLSLETYELFTSGILRLISVDHS